MKIPKITIVGAGGTGAQTAQALSGHGHFNLVLIDVLGEMAVGKALDIWQSGALLQRDIHMAASDDLRATEGSDVVVITAGIGRRPGLAREALLQTNAMVVSDIASQTAALSPDAYIIVLTNPADLLTRVAWQASGFPSRRVIGQGGILDSARLAVFISEALNWSVRDVQCMVLGGHGDSMVPVRDFVSVRGMPAGRLLSDTDWHHIVTRTRFGGGEILGKLKTHGASVTPGLALAQMVEALLSPIPRLLPISTRAGGSYGIEGDVFLGLPALLSARGVERVVEYPLGPEDLSALHRSAEGMDAQWLTWAAQT